MTMFLIHTSRQCYTCVCIRHIIQTTDQQGKVLQRWACWRQFCRQAIRNTQKQINRTRTAHNPTEMPDQENIALKNPYTRDRLAPYAQQLSSPYIIRKDSSENSDHTEGLHGGAPCTHIIKKESLSDTCSARGSPNYSPRVPDLVYCAAIRVFGNGS